MSDLELVRNLFLHDIAKQGKVENCSQNHLSVPSLHRCLKVVVDLPNLSFKLCFT